MKDRIVTLLGALLAVVIVYVLFFPPRTRVPDSLPLSVEAGRNGYLALYNWLARQGVAVRSLRERYDVLAEPGRFAVSGNILVVTMPFRVPLRESEVAPLRSWIADGNTVLLLAGLDDTPDWMLATGATFIRDLAALTGLRFQAANGGPADGGDDAGDDDARGDGDAAGDGAQKRVSPFDALKPPIAAGTQIDLVPAGQHPLLAGVARLRAYSAGPSATWKVTSPDEYRLALRLAYESSSGLDALWQLPRGRGQIVLAATASLLANRNIGEGDARHFVANLIRHHVGDGGAVIFDDLHHGLSSLYDSQAFLRDSRLHYSIWFLLAAWLVYIVGSSNRLLPPRAPASAPRQGEFIAAAGGFMARRLDKNAAGLMLIEEWLDEVRRSRGLPQGTPLWRELEATPALARAVYEELHGYHRRLGDGATVDLVKLHNVLQQAREAIG